MPNILDTRTHLENDFDALSKTLQWKCILLLFSWLEIAIRIINYYW